MKVEQIELIPIEIPIKRTHKISSFTLNRGIHVIVKIHSDDGIVGLGEAPLSMGPVFPEETYETSIFLIKRYLSPVILGKDPFDIERVIREMERAVEGNYTTKAAVDFALYDLMAKSVELPLYKLIGGLFYEKVPLSWSLAIGDPELDAKEAKEKVSEGFRIFKIKVGISEPSVDIERVRAIREAVGNGVDIRIDVNQGWKPDKAIKIIQKMERYELGFVEQPVPRWDINGMARIAKAIDTPIMADESLYTLHDAITLIEKEAADIFAIKLMKHGGIYNSKKICALAEAADISCYVGSNLETGVATAICVHFAVASSNVTYGCELFGPLLLTDDILKTPIEYREGYIGIPRKIFGLGVEINETKLKNYLIKGERVHKIGKLSVSGEI